MKTTSKKLGLNIRRIRKERQMTQGDICRKTGFDRSYVSNVEAGKSNPTLATIEKIAEALSVSGNELLK
jgi:transcriptional regulator with XRE-family HTH domain